MKLRAKTLIYLSILIIVLIGLTTGLFINRFNLGLNEFLNTRGAELAELLADDIPVAILVNDKTTIKELVLKRAKRPGVIFIKVKDKDEEIVFEHKNESAKKNEHVTFSAPVMWQEGSGNLEDNEDLLFGDDVVVEEEQNPSFKKIGTVYIAISLESINEKQAKMIKTVLLLAAILAIISLGITIRLVQKIVHPIESIAEISGKIASGDYNKRVTVKAKDDEIGTMVNAFNTMAETLQSYTEGLERKVEERTLELRQAHKELENKAFFAGMAEIARGVLHDVNNAMQGLHSNLANLDMSVEDFDIGSLNDIWEYMKGLEQSDEKWSDVLSFFNEVNELFSKSKTEAAKALSECDVIVSHINKIISAQQKHAKSGSTKELLDVNTILRESINIYKKSLEKRNIVLEINLNENLNELYLNEGELERLFGNFIKNGLDAMDEVAGRNHKFIIETMLVDSKTIIKFKDTGSGIKESSLPNIFRPDYTTKESGTGFGLSFCLDFMKRNDGEIFVNTIEGEGTEFMLKFS